MSSEPSDDPNSRVSSWATAVGEESGIRLLVLCNVHVTAARKLHLCHREMEGRGRPPAREHSRFLWRL